MIDRQTPPLVSYGRGIVDRDESWWHSRFLPDPLGQEPGSDEREAPAERVAEPSAS